MIVILEYFFYTIIIIRKKDKLLMKREEFTEASSIKECSVNLGIGREQNKQ